MTQPDITLNILQQPDRSDAEIARRLTESGVHCPGRVRSHWYIEDVRRIRSRLG